MAKPTNTKRKRSEPEDAGERVVVSEVMLRRAALAYAAVADLDPSDPRWRRCWRALQTCGIQDGRGTPGDGGEVGGASTVAGAGVAPIRNSANASTLGGP